MNRAILSEMLGNEYKIIEAADGAEAIAILQKHSVEISLVLLDIVMPVMDGFEVLNVMNQKHWIEDVPVIMISAESSPSHIDRAYELGVTDFISRPFDALIVRRRVVNTIMLYAKQKKLVELAADQIYEKEKNNNLMITILSHIVEVRNGESQLHVLHVKTFTEILLNHLVRKTDKYNLSSSDIMLITNAAAFHDIGKLSIPEEILNKPGKLTDEEFEIMKTHSAAGAAMLEQLTLYKDEPLVKVTYEICRWHHERYDGRGYPDGLKGDEIPISAQIVALADVYDALTSERVYKKAFTHEKALNMILNGECGTFNPIVLECLKDAEAEIRNEQGNNSIIHHHEKEMKNIADEMMRYDELSASEHVLHLLEYERLKSDFFAAVSNEIQFEYTASPSMITLPAHSAEILGLNEIITDPKQDERILALLGEENINNLSDAFHSALPSQPIVQFNCKIALSGDILDAEITCRSMWSNDNPQHFMGAIGKIVILSE